MHSGQVSVPAWRTKASQLSDRVCLQIQNGLGGAVYLESKTDTTLRHSQVAMGVDEAEEGKDCDAASVHHCCRDISVSLELLCKCCAMILGRTTCVMLNLYIFSVGVDIGVKSHAEHSPLRSSVPTPCRTLS